jgi:hypothetical protein
MAAAIQDGSAPLLTRGRVDRVHVQVGYRSRPDGVAETHFLLDVPVADDGVPPDQDEMLRLLEPVVHAGADAPRHHSLHVHRWHTSWGAAAGALDIGLTVTVRTPVTAGSAAYDAVVGAFRDLLHLSDPPAPLTRSAAVAAARRSVAAAYGRDADDLALSSEQHQVESGTWSLGLRAPDQHRFVVVVGIVDGFAGSVHLRHEAAGEVHDSLGTE